MVIFNRRVQAMTKPLTPSEMRAATWWTQCYCSRTPTSNVLIQDVMMKYALAVRACDRHARRVLRPNRIKETSRSSHERGHAYTQMSWSRCCHVAAGCALSMQGTSAGNRIKDLLHTAEKKYSRVMAY
jgi:hypothetical protein